jgi:hypothetical protein
MSTHDVSWSRVVKQEIAMTDQDNELHEPLAELERELIKAYIAGAGYDLHELQKRTDEEARRLLADASRYASAKLCEVEARSHYVHQLHGLP